MMNYKSFFLLFIFIFGISSIFSVDKINENGDFTVMLNTQKAIVFNDDIDTSFSLTIQNNLNYNQDFELYFSDKKGWDIVSNEKSFTLTPGEQKIINLEFSANSDFDYGTNVVSPDLVKISQKNDYAGFFEFPISIIGDDENVSLKFDVDIKSKVDLDEEYSAEFSTNSVSPVIPLNYVVKGENIAVQQDVDIKLLFAQDVYEFTDVFTPNNNYKVYSYNIPSSVSPGTYSAKLVIRLDKNDKTWEWTASRDLNVVEYKKVVIKEGVKRNFFRDRYTLNVTNLGNVPDVFNKDVKVGFFKSFIFSSNADEVGVLVSDVDNGIEFSSELAKGENIVVEYEFNYIPIYALILVVVVLSIYIYVRKSSNPLDVETKIYEVKKVVHEGVKSMKISIGFENIKDVEIESLRLIFRMPSYLSVQENSFLLTEPNHVLKGKEQYKLIWDFKRFEKEDSRILGFALVNKRGILGDIRIPDLEFEVKINGKIRRYYKSFPVIKG